MPQPEQKRILATEIPGPRSRELHERRRAELTDGLGIVLPVFVEQAGGGILVDVDGNHLIDFASGIAVTSVGAGNEEVAAAVSDQVGRFTHTCFMVTEYEGYLEVGAALNRLTPGDHDKKTLLVTTGAEAVENAIKIARSHTGRPAVVVLGHGYHGRTLLTLSMTAKNVPYRQGFGPFAPEVYRAPSPYAYRWPTGPENAAQEALAALKETVLTQLGAENVAAIVAEPIQGEGGFIELPEGYLSGVIEFAHEHGILVIADEIQTGFARTGDMFACDREGTVPDLITTAKALAGGMPLAAVTGRAEVMDAVQAGGLGGTYAGNPAACAAALASLKVIEDQDLIGAARRIEEIIKPRLQALMGDGSRVGDVRGRGAMIAIEFVEPGTQDPAPEFTKAVSARCHEQGVLTLVCGTFGNVIRLLPPLVIGEELLNEGLDVLVAAIEEVS